MTARRETVLSESPRESLPRFLWRCKQAGIDHDFVGRAIREMTAHSKESDRHEQSALCQLERRWYESLERGEPDYDVYDGVEYVAETYYCWSKYSRQYVRSLAASGVMPDGRSVVESVPACTVVDLGCGIGYSTAALSLLWPDARVVGTNVEDAMQLGVVRQLGREYGFEVATGDLSEIGGADVVFASEYFEHFYEPIAHLRDVLAKLRPHTLITANAFTTRSTGHFLEYSIDGEVVPGRAASRRFNAAVAAAGYEKIPLKVWNARPTLWRRRVSE